ncbi:MAG: PD-(D/E)XK nuclease family protein [Candidatus Krumholzibacteriota bacterium]|nr:PD-(D/E)XK nuclease family protein [Candidatus Krumholzibacteriota bacterium]
MTTKTRNLGDILQEFRQHRLVLQQELQKVIIGQDEVIEQMVDELCDAEHGLGRRDSIMNVAMRKHLAGLGAEFRAMEKTRVGDYRIDRTEVTEGYEVAGISFRGKIDRVDDVGGKVVVIDYKTGKIHKTGKSLREYSLGEKSGDRHWQIPMYSYGIANKTGQWPHAFCYYVFPPDGEPIIVGLFVADSMPDLRHFADIPSKRFDSISPAELQTLMTDAADITAEIFGERERFERTDDLKKCANCYFNRLCMRHAT